MMKEDDSGRSGWWWEFESTDRGGGGPNVSMTTLSGGRHQMGAPSGGGPNLDGRGGGRHRMGAPSGGGPNGVGLALENPENAPGMPNDGDGPRITNVSRGNGSP